MAVIMQIKDSPKRNKTSPKNPVTENLKGFLKIIWKTCHAEGQKFLPVIPILKKLKNVIIFEFYEKLR